MRVDASVCIVGLRDQSPSSERRSYRGKASMPDLLYVVLALGAFALFALAVEGCERL
jgi:hypothetical protein